ncbi:MAG: hypothetical protein K9L66_07260 [Spirochaetaceae bacterium]|nr:hypothetical protein [Spirochaetaceae bacterium]MCF7951289.1 hypothetical protein [Spirochaetaceae bacterium]
MKKFHENILSNKYKTILIEETIIMLGLVIALAIIKDQTLDSDLLENSFLFLSLGFISVILYPFFYLQKKILLLLNIKTKFIPKPGLFYRAVMLILFYSFIIGILLFILSFLYITNPIPIVFSVPGVTFTFSLLLERT